MGVESGNKCSAHVAGMANVYNLYAGRPPPSEGNLIGLQTNVIKNVFKNKSKMG